MKTTIRFSPPKAVPDYLMPAGLFVARAVLDGITVPERQLILAGRLTPLAVGRDRFYDWRQVLEAMPEQARAAHAELAAKVSRAVQAGGAR